MTTELQPVAERVRKRPAPLRPARPARHRSTGAVRARRGVRNLLVAVTALVVGLFSVFPFFWMALTSIKPDAEVVTPTPQFLPSSFDFSRYGQLWLEGGFSGYTLNSLQVALGTTVLCLLCSALAAYALARFRMPLRRYLILVILAAQMFPLVVLLIPLFIILRNLDLLNSLPGLILADLAFTIPLTVAILRGFFTSIPEQLDEAAMIDGASRVGALFRVVLPVAAPGIAATSIFAFISAWNEFLFALSFTPGADMRVLPVGLALLIGRDTAEWGNIMAGGMIYTLPMVIFFILLHRHLMGGMAIGAVKG